MNKIKTIDEIVDQNIEKLLNDKMFEFNISNNVKTKQEVSIKIRQSMMTTRPNFNNHQMDLSSIPKNIISPNGAETSYSDIKPKNTLPKNISKEVISAGISNISWTDLNDLPMAQNAQIRNMGNIVFQAFGLKQNSKIKTISALKDNDLLNSNLELNSVLSFIDKNAEKVFDTPQTQIFSKQGCYIDNYKPKIQVYNTNDKAYLVVFEESGQGMEGRYIYEFERDLKLQNKMKEQLTNNKPKLIKRV